MDNLDIKPFTYMFRKYSRVYGHPDKFKDLWPLYKKFRLC